MPITTVAVTCTAARPDGSLIAGGKFRFLLSAADTENGLIVPKEITATANSSGVAVANLWPNSLGAAGTQYRVLLSDPAGGTLDLGSCTVPTSATNLHAILGLGAAPTIDQATVAKLAAQTAAAASSASATQSATSATNAATSATAAAGSATAAQTSATSAAGSVSTVATSATNAANSATAAGNSATSAAASNTAAGTSATNAASSATAAATSATSASTSASDALASKNAAATSATNSSNSATNSATSATNSANSATDSATSATAALASQNAAATSATNASTSAATASTQAGIATTQANNAATSAASAASNAAAVAAATTGNMSAQNADAVAITGGSVSDTSITIKDNVFTLQDNLDPTKQAQFQLSGITTATTRAYTLPNLDTGLAGLGGTETFTGSKTFSATTLNFGTSVAGSTTQIASGATNSGNPKIVNIGTNGSSGSTTNITVGSANGSTTTMLGTTVIGGAAGSQSLQVNNVASAVNYLQAVGAVTGGNPTFSAQGTDADIAITYQSKGLGPHRFINGAGAVNFQINTQATVANQWLMTATGSFTSPLFQVVGSDTNIDARFKSKGTGAVQLITGAALQVNVTDTTSAVNYLQLTGAATGAAPTISAQGSDANINLTLTPKGTGLIVAGNAVSSANGFLIGSSNNLIYQSSASTLQFRIGTSPAYFGFVDNSGQMGITSGNPILFTGSGGTTFRISNSVASSVNYVQVDSATTGAAPTISAQGSNANVGLGLTAKGTGNINLSNGSGLQVQINDSFGTAVNYFSFGGSTTGFTPAMVMKGSDANIGAALTTKGTGTYVFWSGNFSRINAVINTVASSVNFLQLAPAVTGAAPTLYADGSDANIGLVLTGKGTGVVALGGSTAANSGFRVNPITSSVNYIQVNGNTAGNGVNLQAEGADANIQLSIRAKGTSNMPFFTGGGTQVTISDTSLAVNRINLTGAATTGAPEVSAIGSDANINLKLTPKGTGVLQFGTYTAGVLSPTGFITITDAAGTSRRLLVG